MKHVIPEAALAQHIIALGKTGAGKSAKLRVLVEGLLDRKLPVCIVDPKGDWWGLKSAADGRRPGYAVVIFGGTHADVPLNARAGAQVAELIGTGNRPCLIDLRGWMPGERTRFFIDFASTLFKTNKGARHLVIDEVHNFAPKGKILSPEAGEMLHWANRLASEGRGLGLTLIAASQRPQKVHNDFLTSCETLIACRVIHKADRDAIKDWIDGCADPELGKQVLQELAGMKRPEAWVWSPEIDFGPKRITWPMFTTYDSFKPQEANAPNLKGWADVDLEDVRAKLAKVVQEAEANDPKILKRRIAELERLQKSGAPASPAVSKADLQAAEQRGYERGQHAGAVEAQRVAAAHLKAIRGEAHKALEAALSAPMSLNSRATPAPAVRSAAPVQRQAPVIIAAAGPGEKLPKAEKSILRALAEYPDGRSKVQVAILTGYAHNGGGFNNALGSLRTSSYIDGDSGRLKITAEGLRALGPFDPLPRGKELLEHWLRQLGKAERSVLQALTDANPPLLSKERLAELAGYEPSGGGFNNALGRLRALELISGRGELRASEDLF